MLTWPRGRPGRTVTTHTGRESIRGGRWEERAIGGSGMSSDTNDQVLPIGKVVEELSAEYPDVTHSSLRFLENQGTLSSDPNAGRPSAVQPGRCRADTPDKGMAATTSVAWGDS